MHTELVSDLSTESFLAAFRIFVARRGKPETVFTDNRTNFQGANNQLKEVSQALEKDSLSEGTTDF